MATSKKKTSSRNLSQNIVAINLNRLILASIPAEIAIAELYENIEFEEIKI